MFSSNRFQKNKKIFILGILALILGGVLMYPNYTFAYIQSNTLEGCGTNTQCQACIQSGGVWDDSVVDNFCKGGTAGDKGDLTNAAEKIAGSYIFEAFARGIGTFLSSISALILTLVGYLFDTVIQFSIVDMAGNVSNPEGVGGAIQSAWQTLRDVANMVFIFILLYAAFKAMFDTNFTNFGKTVVDIIIVVLLINFSLFFTKVIIDASNIVSVGFYNSIQAANSTNTSDAQKLNGISKGYMNALGLQKWFTPTLLTIPGITGGLEILTYGVMTSVFLLVTAVVFLMSSVMFLARFIILIFLMIVSALAAIAYIIPGQRKLFNQFIDTLTSQAIFAPAFFALTWVALKLASAGKLVGKFATGENVSPPQDLLQKLGAGSMEILLKYSLVIGLAVAALVTAKSIASKATGFASISGGIGTAAFGGAAFAARNSIGAVGNWVSKNNKLQVAQADENSLLKRTGARLALYTGKKAASSTFDARNAAIPTRAVGDLIEGTIGRTGFGKKIGLDEVNIPSVQLGKSLAGKDFGTAGTKGYKELRAEKDKRMRDRDAAVRTEVNLAKAREAINKGKNASKLNKDGTINKDYEMMEMAMAKLSEKETETLVASNRDLLDSLNFANMLSVQQLQFLMKSDNLSEEDKTRLKTARFKSIENIKYADGLAALDKEKRGETLTDEEKAQAKLVKDAREKVKSLTDAELEMLPPSYFDLSDDSKTKEFAKEFIGTLKAGQVEHITTKSTKFTSTQKANVKEEKMRPLKESLDKPLPRSGADKKIIRDLVKKADTKTLVGYMTTPGGAKGFIGIDPDVLPIYNSQILTKMAAHENMTPENVTTLREALENTIDPVTSRPYANEKTLKWLNEEEKGQVLFPS